MLVYLLSIDIDTMIEVTQASLAISSPKPSYQCQLTIPRRCFRRKWFSFFFFLFKFALKTFCFLSSTINENDKNLLQNSHYESISSVPGMDDAEFRRRGKEMIDYIADYLKHIRYDSISKINDEFISFLFCFDIKKENVV